MDILYLKWVHMGEKPIASTDAGFSFVKGRTKVLLTLCPTAILPFGLSCRCFLLVNGHQPPHIDPHQAQLSVAAHHCKQRSVAHTSPCLSTSPGSKNRTSEPNLRSCYLVKLFEKCCLAANQVAVANLIE